MGDELWSQLPAGFLKKSPKGWLRLDHDVRRLVVELAREQNFKCAFCDTAKGLIIEHDHWPERGSGDKLTIYNVRGLACTRCNWHLGMYEADARGDCRGWEDAYIYISERDLEPYAYAYECRILALFEEELEHRLGPRNYWRRRLFLQRADDFREWGGRSLWRLHFTELKERQCWKIRTPDQFWKVLAACMRFVVEETRRNPDFVIPDQFLLILARVKPILDEIWPQIEDRYRAIQAKNQAVALQAPGSPQFADQVLA